MSPLLANAGLPMIGKAWPAAWALLIPVVLVESIVAWRVFRSRFDDGLVISLAADVASTLVGIPLGWFLMYLSVGLLGVSFDVMTPTGRFLNSTLGSPVLLVGDGFDDRHLNWMIPAAGASLCLPFFLASVGVEGLVARLIVPREARSKVWRWALLANAATYIPIALGLVALSAWHASRIG